MNAQEFCYWLNGYLEMSDDKFINENKTKMIKEHLSLVFNKVTSVDKINDFLKENPFYSNEKYKITCGTDRNNTLLC